MSNVRRCLRMFLSLILVLSLVMTITPAMAATVQMESYDYQAQGLDRPDLISYDLAKSKGHIKRLTNLENENTFVFQNLDGTVTSYTYEQPVQSRDENGRLQESSLAFQPTQDEKGQTTGYALNGAGHTTALPSALSGGQAIAVNTAEYTLSMSPLDSQGGKSASSPGRLGKTGDYNGKVSYAGAYGQDTTLTISSTLSGIKEDIILQRSPKSNVFSSEISAPGLTGKVAADGSVVFYDPTTLKRVYEIPAPYAIDSFKGARLDGDGHYTEAIQVTLTKTGEGCYTYSMAVDPEFLGSPKTVYPVTIDPTITISGTTDTSDTYVSEENPNTNYNTSTQLSVGYNDSLGICRAYIKYDLADLTGEDALMVTEAQYLATEYSGSTNTVYLEIHQVTGSWSSSTVKFSNQPATSETIIDSVLVNAAGQYSFDMTALVENWLLNAKGAGGYANNGFALISDREDTIRLRRFRSAQSSTSPPSLVITYTAVDRVSPNPPTGLTTSTIKNTGYDGTARLKASWTAATDLPALNGSGIKNYEVIVKNASNETIASGTTSNTWYTTPGFFPDNANYTFYVRAVDNAREIDGTGIYNESTDATANLSVANCEKPSIESLTVSPANWTDDASLTLSWSVTDGDGLDNIKYSIDGGSETTLSAPGLSGSTGVSTSGLSSAPHTLSVRFTDTQGNTATSAKTIYIDQTDPSSPALSSAGETSSSIALTWSVSTDNVAIDAYKIYSGQNLLTTTTGTTYTATGLSSLTQYSFSIEAYDTAGNLATSNTLQVSTNGTPSSDTPTGLTATTVTGTTVDLSWSAPADPSNITGYRVYDGQSLIASPTSTSCQITGLTNGTQHTYTVKAYRSNDTLSPASNAITFSTLDTAVPSTPANFALGLVTGTSIELSWSAATDNVGVIGYRVYHGTDYAFTTAGGYTFAGLIPGVQYAFTVKAVDAAGNESAATDEITATTVQRASGRLPLRQSAEIGIVGGDAFADLQTGNVNYIVEDFQLPAWQFGMAVTRNYNSQTISGTTMGRGWELGLNLYLIEDYAFVEDSIPQAVTFRDTQGTYWSFTVETASGQVTGYTPPMGCPYTLEKESNLYRLTDDMGLVYAFDSNLKLATVSEVPYLMETEADGKLSLLTLANQSGSLNWLFNVTTNEQGEITAITADDESCPFTLSENPTTDQYLLTETETPANTYSFETNDPEEHGELLKMTTTITSGMLISIARLTFTWNASGQLTGVEDEADHALALDYDEEGRVTEITDAEGRQVKYTYTQDGLLAEVERLDHCTDPATQSGPVYAETLYTYDNNGFLATVCDADNVTEQLEFDSTGKLTKHAALYYDSANPTTQLRTMGRKIELIDYNTGNTAVRRQYQESTQASGSQQETITDLVRIGKTSYSIDAMNDRISAIAIYPEPILNAGQDGEDESDFTYTLLRTTALTYSDEDEDGWVDTISQTTSDQDAGTPNLTGTSYVGGSSPAFYALYVPEDEEHTALYDLAGRLAAVCPDVEHHDDPGHVCEQYTYTLAGRPLTELSETGNLTTYTYDSSGRVYETVYPDEHLSVCEYSFVVYEEVDGSGNHEFTSEFDTSYSDYGTNIYTFTSFDGLGQTDYEDIRSSGEILSLEYGYNGIGQKEWQMDQIGNETTFEYNTHGDVVLQTVDQISGPDLITTYTYNDDFALTLEEDPYGNTTAYTYEAEGDKRLLTKSTTVNGESTVESYNYTVDENGCYTLTTTAPDSTETVTKISESSGQNESVSKAVSNLVGGSAIQNTYAYDEEGQLAEIGHNGFSYVFAKDDEGNITSISITDGTNSLTLISKSETDNADGSKTHTDTYANGQAVTQVTDKLGRTQLISYDDGSGAEDLYEYSYVDEDSEPDNGQEGAIVEDYSTGWRTSVFVNDDETSYVRGTGVEDLDTEEELYWCETINEEDYIEFFIDIGGAEQSYEYVKDALGRLYTTWYELEDETTVENINGYGGYGQQTSSNLEINGTTRLAKSYTYKTISGVDFSGLVETESIQQGGSTTQYLYTYDDNGNITKIRKTEGGNTTDLYRYVYDEAGQLVREDNLVTSQTITWQYDIGGNIQTKKVYDITAENTAPDEQDLIDNIPYTYSTGIWKDLLVSYDGQSIVYDDSGNPTTYLGATLAWTMGRRLESFSEGGLSVQYTYNQDGIRTSKTVNSVRTDYYLNGTQVIAEVTGEDQIDYRYDGYGNLIALRWDGDEYYTVTNIQGDIIGLIDGNGTSVVKYAYDAWGNQTSCTGTLANTLGQANPYRYRGYRFDTETGLYYLQSRYYDAAVGRFVNADDLRILDYGFNHINSSNLLVYCINSPINYSDEKGYSAQSIVYEIIILILTVASLWSPIRMLCLGATIVVSLYLIAITIIDYNDTIKFLNDEKNRGRLTFSQYNYEKKLADTCYYMSLASTALSMIVIGLGLSILKGAIASAALKVVSGILGLTAWTVAMTVVDIISTITFKTRLQNYRRQANSRYA